MNELIDTASPETSLCIQDQSDEMLELLHKVVNHPKGKIKVAVTDMDGILRGKYIHPNKFLSAMENGFGFCNVVFGWDTGDVCYDNVTYTGWDSGFPDAQAKIDINTYREIPWEDNLPFFLADFANEICPRVLLKKIKKRVEDLGYHSVCAQEFEWFNFQETPDQLCEKNYTKPKPLSPSVNAYSLLRAARNNDFLQDLFDLLAKFSIPLEGLHTETGPGVLEAAILYSDILEAGDRATLFKQAVKEIAMKHNIMASFMSKWNENLAGCGGHIHQSLWSGNTNLFYDKNDPLCMSDMMKSYLAGQLYCLPHVLPMYAPNINSYKRLVEGAWAPTTLTWGHDNRTTAIRILSGGEKSTRIEFRVAGSDVNPYLAIAASVASGIYGIENKLKLNTPMTVGNGYRNKTNGALPRTLFEATQAMENSEIAKSLFGETFVNHFTQTRHWEWNQSLKPVTDWEIKRYFEII